MFIILGLLLWAGALGACVAGIVRTVRRRRAEPLLWTALGLLAAGLVCMAAASGAGMEAPVLALGLALLTGGVVGLVTGLVQRLRKRPYLARRRVGLGMLAGGAALTLVGASGGSVANALLMGGLALAPVTLASLAMLLACRLRKKSLGLTVVVAPVSLALCVGLVWASGPAGDYERARAAELHEIHALEILQTELDFEVEDGDEPLEVLEYESTEGFSGQHIRVYDSEHLDMLLSETGSATPEACKQRIEANARIPDKFKAYFCDFVDRIAERYPEADLTVLYHNLATLSVTELSRTDYLLKSLSTNSLGVYFLSENAIYIPEGTEYVEGEFGFQVLVHEFCHAMRSCWLNGSSAQSALFEVRSEDELLNECMNTVFSCSLLDYDERDLAYQAPSNYLSVMLECMDNYELSDYVNHGSTYFLSKLDEASGYTNYASVIWKLISLQRNDWYEDDIDIPVESYDPICDFICKMYFDRHLAPGMTDAERRAVADELADKLFYDIPDDYPANRGRVYEYLDIYLQSA